MKENIIGREREQQILEERLSSGRAEFIAVYGRRRVGKTFLIKEYFEKAGYNVGINSPYSNSLTPPSEYEYKSFMIEVNKSIYLDKDNRFTSSAYTVSCLLEYLYRNILFVWNC